MARGVLRRMDINIMGGIAMPFQNSVICNGRPVARQRDIVMPHAFPPSPPKPIHPPNPILLGGFTVIVAGSPIARHFDLELLLHPFVTASTDTVTI